MIKSKRSGSHSDSVSYGLASSKRSGSHLHFEIKGNCLKCKRSQITLFVLFALVIIAGIFLIFFIAKKPETKIIPEENPLEFIQQCISEQLAKDEAALIESNLYPNRTYNTINYRGISVPYLCSVSQFYTPCVNQEPMLMGYVEKYLQNKTKINAEKCFSQLTEILKSKNYEVNENPLELDVELFEGKIKVNINKKITIKKTPESKTYESFNFEMTSPIYRLVDTVRNILNYESITCEFNEVDWEINYRDVEIERFSASDQTKVYTITDKDSGDKINFAVKTCALPAGI